MVVSVRAGVVRALGEAGVWRVGGGVNAAVNLGLWMGVRRRGGGCCCGFEGVGVWGLGEGGAWG